MSLLYMYTMSCLRSGPWQNSMYTLTSVASQRGGMTRGRKSAKVQFLSTWPFLAIFPFWIHILSTCFKFVHSSQQQYKFLLRNLTTHPLPPGLATGLCLLYVYPSCVIFTYKLYIYTGVNAKVVINLTTVTNVVRSAACACGEAEHVSGHMFVAFVQGKSPGQS